MNILPQFKKPTFKKKKKLGKLRPKASLIFSIIVYISATRPHIMLVLGYVFLNIIKY